MADASIMDEPVGPSSWSPAQWDKFLEGKRPFAGFSIKSDREGIRIAPSRGTTHQLTPMDGNSDKESPFYGIAFVIKQNCKPEYSTYNSEESSTSTVTTQDQHSARKSRSDATGFNAGMSFKPLDITIIDGKATASWTVESNAKSDHSNTAEQIQFGHYVHKLRLFWDPDWMELSTECGAALERLRSNPSIALMSSFYDSYGTLLPKELIFGGFLRWSRATSGVSGETNEAKERNLRAFVEAKYLAAGGSGSYSSRQDSTDATSSQENNMTAQFTRVGGSSGFRGGLRSESELKTWYESFKSPANWEVIKHCQLVPTEKIIGQIRGKEWVHELFEKIKYPVLPNLPPPLRGSDVYSENTSFAFLELDYGYTQISLLFFQDPEGWIRWGTLGDFPASAFRPEVLFKEDIVRARRDTKLAARALVDPEEDISSPDRYSEILLYYLDDESMVCQHSFSFVDRKWIGRPRQHPVPELPRESEFVPFPVHNKTRSESSGDGASDGSVTGSDDTESTGEAATGDGKMYGYGHNVDTYGRLYPHEYTMPGSFEPREAENIPLIQYIGSLRRSSCMLACCETPFFDAYLSEHDKIDIRNCHTHLHPVHASHDDSEDEAGEDIEIESSDYASVCTIGRGSNFCAVRIQEDYDDRMPGLIFFSPSGKMCMIRIDLGQGELARFPVRSIFGPATVEASTHNFFTSLSNHLHLEHWRHHSALSDFCAVVGMDRVEFLDKRLSGQARLGWQR
ncbi:hypothetical protein PV04_04686 [Phialophora macrospora]|uniref:Uncharacterized protein n=1 Tax=Phialophora macrospora TaxID=1851006 RepID=A0A0D2G9Y4_9EURO|nr:hypothetical protein PV04_04686 [Phialophora macrospora]